MINLLNDYKKPLQHLQYTEKVYKIRFFQFCMISYFPQSLNLTNDLFIHNSLKFFNPCLYLKFKLSNSKEIEILLINSVLKFEGYFLCSSFIICFKLFSINYKNYF